MLVHRGCIRIIVLVRVLVGLLLGLLIVAREVRVYLGELIVE